MQNLRGLFFRSLTILILVIYAKVIYTNKEIKIQFIQLVHIKMTIVREQEKIPLRFFAML